MTFFDKQAHSYDEWYKTKFGNFIDKVETDLAFKLFKPEKGMKIFAKASSAIPTPLSSTVIMIAFSGLNEAESRMLGSFRPSTA